MVDFNNLMNQAIEAAQIDDQTASKPAFEYEIAPAGFTVARLVAYIETGSQPQRAYQGQEKPDAPKVRLAFELLGKNHITTYEANGETKTRTNVIRVDLPLFTSDKSNYSKLFKSMRAGDETVKHMAQLLGKPFLIKVTHGKSKDGTKTYANIKEDGVWNVGPAIHTDVITNETTVLPVPEATVPLQMLLWGNPSQEQWGSIFIDGSYTRTVDGVEVTQSKNFLQEECLAASNFAGSALQAMLGGAQDVIEAMSKPEPAPVAAEPAPAVMEDTDDILAAVGL